MEQLCFSAERDPAFARTPAQPRLPPPVLGRDGKISFPPRAGFGDSAPQAPAGPTGRMQCVPASGQAAAQTPPAPAARPTVQVDVTARADPQSREERSYPTTPQTPTTPTTPATPGEHGGQGLKFGNPAEGEHAEHTPRSPEMAPPEAEGRGQANGKANGNDDPASFAPGMDDAASFAPGMDDDVGNFAPGADYAAPSSSYATASSGYSADGDAYAPGSPPQVNCSFVRSTRVRRVVVLYLISA